MKLRFKYLPAVAFLISGCIDVEIDTLAMRDADSKQENTYAYNYLCGTWRKDLEPQDTFDKQVAIVSSDDCETAIKPLDRRAIQKFRVTRTWVQTVESIASFGLYTPVTVEWWLEKDCKKCYPNTCGCYENGCNQCSLKSDEPILTQEVVHE